MSLVPYGPVVEAWAQWTPPGDAPVWSQAVCVDGWRRGVPLLAESPLTLDPGDVEDVVAVGLAMAVISAGRDAF